MSDTELLPCPFCGKPARVYQDQSSDYERQWWWNAECTDWDHCGADMTGMASKEAAIAKWNSRITYTHRNGETAAPTVPGRYWFDGTTISKNSPSPSVLKGTTRVIEDHGELLAWLDIWDGGQYESIEQFSGAWWGPLLAPWEQS